MSEDYLRPNEVEKILKVTGRTIYNWEKQGKIKCVRTKGGHRRFKKSDIFGLEEINILPSNKRRICYCRVSTRSQKEDLERQVEFFRKHYPNHEIIKDYGSGLNSKRKGFNTILDEAIKGNLGELVVTHRDRLCRFNYEIFERIINQYSGGTIVVLDKTKTSPEKEIVDDLISIITVFSSRVYGLRSNSIKKKIKEEVNEKSEDPNIENLPEL
jgi:excisionase family DNA binding protein